MSMPIDLDKKLKEYTKEELILGIEEFDEEEIKHFVYDKEIEV